jgi:hypothetical protein
VGSVLCISSSDRFGWDAVIERTLEVYRDALAADAASIASA